MNEEQLKLITDIKQSIDTATDAKVKAALVEMKNEIESLAKKSVTPEELNVKVSEISTKFEVIATMQKSFDVLNAVVKKQGIEINGLKNQEAQNESAKTKGDRIREMAAKFVNTEDFKILQKGNDGKTKTYSEEELKLKVVDITSDYTGGTVLITKPSGSVIDVPNRAIHVRNILSVTQTDQPNIVGQEIYAWSDKYTGSTNVLAENATADEGSFKIKENTWGIKRIAAFYNLSKRMIKSNGTKWVMNKLMNVLPLKLQLTEDKELLYGDGSGDHVIGLSKNATVVNFAGNTYTAGAVASVATWNSNAQSIVTFAAAHNLRTGDNLTIANATASGYNTTHRSVVVLSETQVLLHVAYVAEANTSAWTGTSTHPLYHAIDNAQEYDVLLAVAGDVVYRDRMINAFIMNPTDVAKIEMLKGTDAHYVGVGRNDRGVFTVKGLPVIETTAVPSGKFFAGVFDSEVCEIAEFTQLSMFATTDVTYAKENKVAIIIEEEIIFPIYEPLAIVYGDFTTIKTALETA